jgi:ATP-dependent Clp protease protease subunit
MKSLKQINNTSDGSDDQGSSASGLSLLPMDNFSIQALGSHMLFGEISEESSLYTIEFLLKANMLLPDSYVLNLFINSPGGHVTDGFAIIDVMETSRLPIQTVGVGLIASMALLILAAGHKGRRILTKNSAIMAHQFYSYLEGKHHELIAGQKRHVQLEQQFIKYFMAHSDMTEKQIKDILLAPSDRWLTPQECKKYGLCDVVTEHFVPPETKEIKEVKVQRKVKTSR